LFLAAFSANRLIFAVIFIVFLLHVSARSSSAPRFLSSQEFVLSLPTLFRPRFSLLKSLRHHPKRVTAALAVLLLGTGVTAFGVAPLAPDAADLPVRQIVESIEPLAMRAQTDRLADFRFNLYRTENTRPTDTADSLLRRLNINDPAAADFLRKDVQGRLVLTGRAGKTVTAEVDDAQQLVKLSLRWATDDAAMFKRLVIQRDPIGFTARVETAPYTATSQLASGNVQTSLFAATDAARIPDSVATQLAEIFASEIDFRTALRKGDRFNVVYETLEADGEALRPGRVLSAEFVNGGKTHQAMWFQPPGKDASGAPFKGSYYGLDGKSLRRAYLGSPLEFSRVTSGFSMRMHPVLQKWRAHLGTDFAAPIGTPARTVGDGVVTFAGVQNGYGNVVFIKHRNNHETVYAHLSKILVRVGQNVAQSDTIGLVGSTGWSTGPHLHLEFRVNGVHQDPMMMAQQSDTVPVPGASLAEFKRLAEGARSQLLAASTITASRRFE
jgi:murein DD-endopeptidase MepM/ murein hydrolase activator NlpD